MNRRTQLGAVLCMTLIGTAPPLRAEGPSRSQTGQVEYRTGQRKPRIEMHGLLGFYSTQVHSGRLKPEVGVGVLLPVGPKFAVLVDATAGVPRVNENQWKPGDPFDLQTVFYARNLHLFNVDEDWRMVSTLRPSVVRTWRRDRYSIYAGVGLGLEFERNRWHYQRILQVFDEEGNAVGLESEDHLIGKLLREDTFTSGKRRYVQKSLVVRSGVLVSLTPRVVVRAGYSYLINSVGDPLSGAIEASIGYRF